MPRCVGSGSQLQRGFVHLSQQRAFAVHHSTQLLWRPAKKVDKLEKPSFSIFSSHLQPCVTGNTNTPLLEARHETAPRGQTQSSRTAAP